MSYVDRSSTKAYSAGTIAPLAAGYILSRFIGAVAWVPAILGGASFVLLKKLVDRNSAVSACLAALIAQTGWFTVGAIFVPSQAASVIPDILINCILIAIIFFKPGYVSAGLALVWSLFGSAIAGVQLANAPDAAGNALVSVEQRALIAHLILRLIIAGAAVMIMVYKANPDLLPAPEEDEELREVFE